MEKNRTAAIRHLLERSPVCLEIAQYLVRHNEAADTVRGIAEWWINRDIYSTQDALGRLLACGVVRSYPVQDQTFVYAFTRNPIMRQTVARYVDGVRLASPAAGA